MATNNARWNALTASETEFLVRRAAHSDLKVLLCDSVLTHSNANRTICTNEQAEQELITILPHFQIKENSGVLNFIGVRTATTWVALVQRYCGADYDHDVMQICRATLDRSSRG